MSRIGRLPVAIPAGVTVEVAENNVVTVKGPKGTLTKELPVEMEIKVEGEEVIVTRPSDLKKMKEYIAEDNEEMAVKTIREIYARFENIQQFPYMGADLAKRVSFRTDYKYVICGNYVVLYKVGKEYVEIYRVVNRYQDITKIF